MKLWVPFAAGAGSLLTIAMLVGAGWDAPPVEAEQLGYRGSGMVIFRDVEDQKALREANVPPPSPYEPDPSGERASEIYENVQILGDLSSDQFNHFMASITEWVSPEEGCGYCHNLENMASDEVYTKVVARRMIQMNQKINVDWQAHVAETGVTCYTCHRGNPVPANIWTVPEKEGLAQNGASEMTGYTSLPQAALANYLLEDQPIRVHTLNAFPDPENKAGLKETEATFSLMMHMSTSLGANCTTCHNSRAFNDWDQSPPQRVTAWHGIRMARELNNEYIEGLAPVFPENRKGAAGDVYKIGCSTCHNGIQKPLYGASMLKEYMDSLASITSTDVPDYGQYVPGETMQLGEPQAAPASSNMQDDGSSMESDGSTMEGEADDAAPGDDAASASSDGGTMANGNDASMSDSASPDQPAEEQPATGELLPDSGNQQN